MSIQHTTPYFSSNVRARFTVSWWSHWYDNIAYRLPSSTVTAAGADNPQFGVWVIPRTLALVLEILRLLVGARVEMDALVGVLLLLLFVLARVLLLPASVVVRTPLDGDGRRTACSSMSDDTCALPMVVDGELSGAPPCGTVSRLPLVRGKIESGAGTEGG